MLTHSSKHWDRQTGMQTVNMATISSMCISRNPDQNGVSLLHIMHEIHLSGREPSICYHTNKGTFGLSGLSSSSSLSCSSELSPTSRFTDNDLGFKGTSSSSEDSFCTFVFLLLEFCNDNVRAIHGWTQRKNIQFFRLTTSLSIPIMFWVSVIFLCMEWTKRQDNYYPMYTGHHWWFQAGKHGHAMNLYTQSETCCLLVT